MSLCSLRIDFYFDVREIELLDKVHIEDSNKQLHNLHNQDLHLNHIYIEELYVSTYAEPNISNTA